MTPTGDAVRAGVCVALAGLLLEEGQHARVRDVRVGLGYTAVALDDGRCGVALTFRDAALEGCSAVCRLRPLAGRSASELLTLLPSENAVEAGVGLACANAISNRDAAKHLPGDVLEHIGIGGGDRVGMVGHFAPLVGAIERRAGSLVIFERIERPSGRLRPQREALEELPACDVAIITASAIINHTIDALLAAASGAREVVILGATTPLVKEAFAGRATALSGIVVREPDALLRAVSEGGGMHQFGPHIRKVTLRLE
jgi:uncharacterized protein